MLSQSIVGYLERLYKDVGSGDLRSFWLLDNLEKEFQELFLKQFSCLDQFVCLEDTDHL